MLVQIDESRRDVEPCRVNHALAAECRRRNARDLAVANADGAHRIEPGFGVHDASAFDHDVELLSGKQAAAEEKNEEKKKEKEFPHKRPIIRPGGMAGQHTRVARGTAASPWRACAHN